MWYCFHFMVHLEKGQCESNQFGPGQSIWTNTLSWCEYTLTISLNAQSWKLKERANIYNKNNILWGPRVELGVKYPVWPYKTPSPHTWFICLCIHVELPNHYRWHSPSHAILGSLPPSISSLALSISSYLSIFLHRMLSLSHLSSGFSMTRCVARMAV